MTDTTAGEGVKRGPITHEVKCWTVPFAAVKSGAKPWELRKNDRDYRVGDTLIQHEWEPDECRFTGDSVEHVIGWALYGPAFGLPEGYVIMSLAAQPSAGAQAKYALREDNDGKLQIYSATFNVLIAQFSRAVPASEREAIGRLIATPAQPDTALSSKPVDVSEGAAAIDKPDTGDVAALREALEKARDHYDMMTRLANGGVVYEIDRNTRKRIRRKLSEVIAAEADAGSKHCRQALAALSKPNAQGREG